MNRDDDRLISLGGSDGGEPPSGAQKSFNALVKRIEQRRARLAEWEAMQPAFHRRFMTQLVPLDARQVELQTRLLHLMDSAHGQKGLGKAQRRTLSTLIVELARGLLAHGEDPGIKTILERHADPGTDAGTDAAGDAMQDDAAQADARRARAEAERRAHHDRRAEKKRSKQQGAADASRKPSNENVRGSLREVYRKLVGALHPDRETDAAERERKTVLMKRVNDAYGRGSLLQLLELQLELEHIDQASLDNLGEARLHDYTRVLEGQLAGLDEELRRVEASFRASYGLAPAGPLSPRKEERRLSVYIVERTRELQAFEEELRRFGDVANLKAWLKGMAR